MPESKWLNAAQIERARKFIQGYYRLARENRTKAINGGLYKLEDVEGKVFLYWQEGTENLTFAIWNFRAMQPPQHLILDGKNFILRAAGPPCPCPDAGDPILFDVDEEDFLVFVLAEFDKAWEQPLNNKRFKCPEAFLAQSLDNICRGDLPYDLFTCTESMRQERGWNKQDNDAYSYIQLGTDVYPIKTPKQRTLADIAMAQTLIRETPEYIGEPHKRMQIGTYRAQFIPFVHDNPNPLRSSQGPVNGFPGDSEQAGSEPSGNPATIIEFPGAHRRPESAPADQASGSLASLSDSEGASDATTDEGPSSAD